MLCFAAMPERVAALAPFTFPSVRGNAITVDRITRGLRERGVDLRLWDLSTMPAAAIEAEVEAYRPTLIHAFHAFRVGPVALRLARRAEIPLVVTMTGTDANHDLVDPARAEVIRRVLEGTRSITVFHVSIAKRIGAARPDLAARVMVIPQSVRLERGEPFDLDARWRTPPDRTLVLFPAGIRMVKDPLLPLVPFDRLILRHPRARLVYAGPVLDPELGDELRRALHDRPWAYHVGELPHRQMASLLAQSDLVLNCSISEGGMANSILESLAMGRPVLASDIEGNRSLIEHGVTGLLFRDAAEFEAQAERLLVDPALRARLGAAGRDHVERLYPSGREIDGYLDAYRRMIPVPSA